MAGVDTAGLGAWLLHQGLIGAPYGPMVSEMCERLVAGGVPLLRANFSMQGCHPSMGAFACRWKRQTGLLHETCARDTRIDYGWDSSPLKTLVDGPGYELRLRVKPSGNGYPVLDEYGAQGATDYIAHQIVTAQDGTQGIGVLTSWMTDAPGGFADAQLDAIRAVLPAFALAMKANSNFDMAPDLAVTYLGSDAGVRTEQEDVEMVAVGALVRIRIGLSALNDAPASTGAV